MNEPLTEEEIIQLNSSIIFFLGRRKHGDVINLRFMINDKLSYDGLTDKVEVRIELPRNKFSKFFLGKKYRWREVYWNEVGPWWDEIRKEIPNLEAKKIKVQNRERQERDAELKKFAENFE